MSLRSLLVENIADLIQKVLRVTTRLDPGTKTDENHMARVIGEEYDFGCSAVAQVNAAKGLDHAKNYLSINESKKRD